jgi:hypothetical protein
MQLAACSLHIIVLHNESVVEIATSCNILYDSLDDGHQIGRKHVAIKGINKNILNVCCGGGFC